MFDVGGAELFIILLVAVIVLGPERLPKAARFAGLWVRRARAQWYSVKSELERELAQEELKRQFAEPLSQMRPQVEQLGNDLRQECEGLDPALPTQVDLRAQPEEAPVMPAQEVEAANVGAPAVEATDEPSVVEAPADAPSDEPRTGDLFGGAPRP